MATARRQEVPGHSGLFLLPPRGPARGPHPTLPSRCRCPPEAELGSCALPQSCFPRCGQHGWQKPGNLLGRSEQVRRPGGWAWHGGDAADAQPPPPWRAAGGQAGGQGRAKPQHSRPPGGGRKGPSLGVAPFGAPVPHVKARARGYSWSSFPCREGIGRAGAAPNNPNRTLDSLLHPPIMGECTGPLIPIGQSRGKRPCVHALTLVPQSPSSPHPGKGTPCRDPEGWGIAGMSRVWKSVGAPPERIIWWGTEQATWHEGGQDRGMVRGPLAQ